MGNFILKISPLVLKVLAWASLALGIISGVMIIIGGGTPDVPQGMAILSIVVGILYWFGLYLVAMVISLLLELKASCKKSL